MSFEGFPGRDVRAKLDHPVIDADAHIVECDFAHLDFVRQIAGAEMAKAALAARDHRGPTVRGFWWGLPSGPHTGDRAMAQLPRYFRSRLDELGIDFAHCYTTRGLGHIYHARRGAAAGELPRAQHALCRDVRRRRRPAAAGGGDPDLYAARGDRGARVRGQGARPQGGHDRHRAARPARGRRPARIRSCIRRNRRARS